MWAIICISVVETLTLFYINPQNFAQCVMFLVRSLALTGSESVWEKNNYMLKNPSSV